MTWLPPPIRQCRLCPPGKYVIAVPRLVAGQFNQNELGFMKTRIEDLSKGLGYSAERGGHDVSWMRLRNL
jgi:hypothetical protein